MRVAIVGDPAEELKVAMDTSLLIAGECNRRGHEVFYASANKLVLLDGQPDAPWLRFDYGLDGARAPADCLGDALVGDTSDFDFVLMRQDPPVDERYISIAQILDFAQCPVLNNPAHVQTFGEKVSVALLPEFCPPSIVSIDPQQIGEFVDQFDNGCVLKPLNEFNGKGVMRLSSKDADLDEIVRLGTEDFTKFVIVQEFVPEVSDGDKRVFLVDGKPIGRMNRIPKSGEWRANIHLGAQPGKFELSKRDEAIVEAVGKLLSRFDMPISCIDIIGDYLTEINVTSPSGIPEINRVYGPGHEQPILDYLEKRARV